uniref:Uncharacterized protein n=1 Tax=Aegilops tauschii subsp. strangulata TaxID=200361 RepID=A0A453N4J2_AEGTS
NIFPTYKGWSWWCVHMWDQQPSPINECTPTHIKNSNLEHVGPTTVTNLHQ